MKFPVCSVCINEGTLCPACNRKIQEGKITTLDFEVANILSKINERHNISDASFLRAIDLGKVVLILTQGDVGLLVGRGGCVVRELSSALGKKVRIAEFSGDIKKSISDIILPARLLGINRVWHGGKELLKVRISKSDLRSLPVDRESLHKVIKQWLGMEVKLEFE